MYETILKLWNGEITPWNDNYTDMHKGYKLNGIIDENKEKISVLLGDKGKELIEDLSNSYFDLHCFLQEEAFYSGFSLGLKLAFEAKEKK